MKRFLLISLCAMPFYGMHAQEKVWLDKKGDIISDSSKASQYVTVFHENGIDRVERYKLDGTHAGTHHYDKFVAERKNRIANGLNKGYYPNGNDSIVVSYKDNKKEGQMMVYHPDGSIHISCVYHNGRLQGLFTQYYADGKLRREEVYKDGICTMGKLLTNDGNNMVHQPYYVVPQFNGGMEAFSSLVMKEVKYPEKAYRQKEFGKVILAFVIDKEGFITKPEVRRSISKSLDKEAMRALKTIALQYKWSPCYIDGELVEAYMTLPVNFVLPY